MTVVHNGCVRVFFEQIRGGVKKTMEITFQLGLRTSEIKSKSLAFSDDVTLSNDLPKRSVKLNLVSRTRFPYFAQARTNIAEESQHSRSQKLPSIRLLGRIAPICFDNLRLRNALPIHHRIFWRQVAIWKSGMIHIVDVAIKTITTTGRTGRHG